MSFDNIVYLISFVLLFIYMSLAFMVAKWRERLDTVDIAWGPAFVTVAWLTVGLKPSFRSWLIVALVSVWAIRLASHILQRARTTGEDPRYLELTKKWKGDLWANAYPRIFLLQGLLVWIVSLPVMVASDTLVGWQWLTWLGLLVWLKGFVVETVADRQLAEFLQRTKRPKVLQTGLWRYSRHPNYYGEILQWWGIAVIALQASWGYIGLLGPLVLTFLIVFVSGIPPIEKRRAKDPEYKDYQRRTSALLLLPPKR